MARRALSRRSLVTGRSECLSIYWLASCALGLPPLVGFCRRATQHPGSLSASLLRICQPLEKRCKYPSTRIASSGINGRLLVPLHTTGRLRGLARAGRPPMMHFMAKSSSCPGSCEHQRIPARHPFTVRPDRARPRPDQQSRTG